MKNLSIILLLSSLFLLSSCSHRVLDFTLISSKNVDLSKGASFVRGKNRVEGKDMVHWIVIFPTGTVNIKEAVDKAIESTPGCVALLDGVIYTKFWWIPYIYGQQSATIEGTPLIDPSMAKNNEDLPTFGKIELDKNGDIKSVVNLSPQEYSTYRSRVTSDSKDVKFNTTLELR